MGSTSRAFGDSLKGTSFCTDRGTFYFPVLRTFITGADSIFRFMYFIDA